MEKNINKKKLFESLKRRFKALVLAGTLAGTATACGPSYYVGEEGLSSSVVTELETENKTEGKTKSKTEGKTEGKTESKTEAKTEGKTESKTEGKTESKTEGKTESKTETKTENKQDPTKANTTGKTNNSGSSNNNTTGKTNTSSSNNNTTGKTNTGSSNNNTSTGKTNNGGSSNNNQGGSQQQSEQPKQQEQTQPQQPQTQPEQPQTQPQQPDPTEPPIRYDLRNDYTKYDMTSAVPDEAMYAIYQLSEELTAELFNGYMHQNQYGMTHGDREATALILALNYNQGLNTEAKGNIFFDMKKDDFAQCCDNLNLAYYQYLYGNKVDFTKYTIDENVGNYINYVTDLFMEYANGNEEPLMSELNTYFEGGSQYSGDVLINYFMRNTENPYNFYAPETETARQSFFDNITGPIYDDFYQYTYYGTAYTR